MEEEIKKLKEENEILKKALRMYVDWTDECGIGWDNFPEEEEKYFDIIQEKGLSYNEGLVYMIIEEAKLALGKEKNEINT